MSFLKSMMNHLGYYRFLFLIWLLFITLNLCSRSLLLFLHTDIFHIETIQSILYGIRMDTIIFSAFGLFFAFFYALGWRLLLRIMLTIFACLVVYLEISTFFFFEQFASRPNYLFIEHAKNTQEIFLMIWGLYPLGVMVITPLLLLLLYVIFTLSRHVHIQGSSRARWLILPIIIVILFLGMRSSLDASTPNQSFYTFSQNNNRNELANNTIFSILYAWHWAENERFGHYGTLDEDEVFQRVRQLSGIESQDRLIREQYSSFSGKKNVILVILESFGHDHVGHLGGTPTTPHLDRLAASGLAFTKMYATGNRTAWGVSSLLTAIYPLPGREYIKALKSQQQFYTIAESFRHHGYQNTFLYSGDADFDNMRAFMLSNGYDQVLGKGSFDTSLKKYTWGYADEALYDKAVKVIESQSEPFFLTLLTLSSHEPFDYPEGKIDLYPQAAVKSFANSIKYADHALGSFYDTLQKKGLLENTIVAFIADHCNQAYGIEDVPVDRYRIAAVILDKSLKAGISYDKISSQIDFGPTLLDIAGLDIKLPSMGSSVFNYQRDSALVMYHQNYAYLTADGFVVYKNGHPAKSFTYNYQPRSPSVDEVKNGLASLLLPHLLYEKGEYQLNSKVISK